MGREDPGLRPIDLARLAGVSAQQIRNYADAGVLPPTPRTPSGYRRFDARHRLALITYRALGAGYGWEPARQIMKAVHAGQEAEALALVDAVHAASHERRLSLRAAGEALEAVAGQTPNSTAAPRAGLRIGEVAALLGVRTSALRVWESCGLLTPAREPMTGYRRYGPADVRDARMVDMLRRGRYPLPQVRAVLDGLRRTGSTDALRTALAERQAELTRRAAAMLEAAGRLHAYLATLHERTASPGAGPWRPRTPMAAARGGVGGDPAFYLGFSGEWSGSRSEVDIE
ncbi:MerR family transcriptional regulator [Sphaerisporangium krabiense]|uniref:DNA-binding transcriptional MerR regulator n=1 Tax=Sphaerisporangium krabiense TaxID=763782 RepID=A0A7W8ZCF4_9ACTN|nr:MerR family transcriptional regulator [Sphaerisporangium krabiense]MBB5631456.1 DNA-binding transcriptional MerR regulator [Sphaerisporangium krabiense]GII60874.1 MerR family transcriptional regulator [Sphaerisporangium krabiense]